LETKQLPATPRHFIRFNPTEALLSKSTKRNGAREE